MGNDHYKKGFSGLIDLATDSESVDTPVKQEEKPSPPPTKHKPAQQPSNVVSENAKGTNTTSSLDKEKSGKVAKIFWSIFSFILVCLVAYISSTPKSQSYQQTPVASSSNPTYSSSKTSYQQPTLNINAELTEASKTGNNARINELLDRGADINTQSTDGSTPLIWASYLGKKDTVELLIRRGALLNSTDNTGSTALIWAIYNEYKEIAEILILSGADLNITDKIGKTALDYAILKNFDNIRTMLSERGAISALSISQSDIVEAQKLLNIIGFPCGSPDGKIGKKTSQAIRSFQQKAGLKVDGELTQSLLQSLKNARKNQEAMLAEITRKAENGDFESQKFLGNAYMFGNNGVSINYAKAVTWLKKAADRGDAVSQVNLGWCYENGKGVPTDKRQAFILYKKAAEQGDDVAQNNLGNCYYFEIGTAQDIGMAKFWLEKAKAQGNKNAAKTLRDITDKEKTSRVAIQGNLEEALITAAKNNNTYLISTLLDRGANINARDDDYNTPLIWAAYYNHYDAAALLLSKGASKYFKDNQGKTALDWAQEKDYWRIVYLLQ